MTLQPRERLDSRQPGPRGRTHRRAGRAHPLGGSAQVRAPSHTTRCDGGDRNRRQHGVRRLGKHARRPPHRDRQLVPRIVSPAPRVDLGRPRRSRGRRRLQHVRAGQKSFTGAPAHPLLVGPRRGDGGVCRAQRTTGADSAEVRHLGAERGHPPSPARAHLRSLGPRPRRRPSRACSRIERSPRHGGRTAPVGERIGPVQPRRVEVRLGEATLAESATERGHGIVRSHARRLDGHLWPQVRLLHPDELTLRPGARLGGGGARAVLDGFGHGIGQRHTADLLRPEGRREARRHHEQHCDRGHLPDGTRRTGGRSCDTRRGATTEGLEDTHEH